MFGPKAPASSRKRATASGRIEYQTQEPRRSESTQPVSVSTFRWCDTVGWLTSQQDVKSQAQTSAADAQLAQDGEPGRVGGALEQPHVGVGLALHDVHGIDKSLYRQVSIWRMPPTGDLKGTGAP